MKPGSMRMNSGLPRSVEGRFSVPLLQVSQLGGHVLSERRWNGQLGSAFESSDVCQAKQYDVRM